MQRQNSNPLISVIIPVYNIEPYLEKCIDSVLNQTYTNLEIILVDDGSTDGSSQVCDKYMTRDKRIKVIHKKNGGLVSARKAGVKVAMGDYTTYVDGDDWIETSMYENMIGQIADADAILCGVKRDYGDGCSLEINKVEEGLYYGKCLEDKVWRRMIYAGTFFERGIQPHVVNILSKTALLKRNQSEVPDGIGVGEDAACLYPLLLQCTKLKIISNCYYHYQMRSDSMMGIVHKDEMDSYKILFFYLKERLSEKEKLRECLMWQLNYYMIFMLMLKKIDVLQGETGLLFPFSGLRIKDKIIIYGAGRFGCELVRYLKGLKREPVLWVDKNVRGDIKDIEEIKSVSFDYLLVAVLMKDIADEIVTRIIQMGVPKDKIKVVDQKQIMEKSKEIEAILSN